MGAAFKDFVDTPEQSVGLDPTVIGTVPSNACQGLMNFIKTSTGNTIYIALGGRTPTTKSYQVILTDDIPSFTLDGLIKGRITALCTDANGILSTFVPFC